MLSLTCVTLRMRVSAVSKVCSRSGWSGVFASNSTQSPAVSDVVASRLQAAGALPLKNRVSTSTRAIAPGCPSRTIVQSCPGARRRRVSHPSAMLRGAPGMMRLFLEPKNMSLLSTTCPPCRTEARSISPEPSALQSGITSP